MGKNPPKWLPGERVNETILQQRKSVEQLRADRELRKPQLKEQREKRKAKLDLKRKKKLQTRTFKPASAILKNAIKAEVSAKKFFKKGERFEGKIKSKSDEQKEKFYGNRKIALIIRARGDELPRPVKAGFERLGLLKIYSARFVHLTPQKDKLVRQLRSFSIVGTPTDDQLEQLIRTRGCFWNPETQSKAYISGNQQIEARLGEHNILCVEDMVAALTNKSEELDPVLESLAPFDFHPPRKLFLERHRTVHQKLEVLNPESFAMYIHQQLNPSKKRVREAPGAPAATTE